MGLERDCIRNRRWLKSEIKTVEISRSNSLWGYLIFAMLVGVAVSNGNEF